MSGEWSPFTTCSAGGAILGAPEKGCRDVSLLRRRTSKTARAPRIEKGLGLRVSTFSDNVVISQLPGANTPQLLMQLATWQLGAAINGFRCAGASQLETLYMRMRSSLVRGSIARTTWKARSAMYPRIVLDPLYPEEFGELGTRRRPLTGPGGVRYVLEGSVQRDGQRTGTPGLVKYCLFGAARQRRDVCWRISLQPQRRVSS